MDTTVKEEIKNTEKYLAQLKAGDTEAVFHCPRCNQDYRFLGNYRELKLCFKCWSETETEKMQELTNGLIGATIVKVEVDKPSPYGVNYDRCHAGIKQLTVKKADGKTVKLLRENHPIMIL